MNLLLFILRLVFGLPATESSDSQRVAIRPDGSTVVLPADSAAGRRLVGRWGWLLQHSLGRDPDFSVYSVVDDFERRLIRKTPHSKDVPPEKLRVAVRASEFRMSAGTDDDFVASCWLSRAST